MYQHTERVETGPRKNICTGANHNYVALQVSAVVHEPRFSIIMEISRWRAALPCGINSLSGTNVRPNLRHTADFILQPTENQPQLQ